MRVITDMAIFHCLKLTAPTFVHVHVHMHLDSKIQRIAGDISHTCMCGVILVRML